MIDKEDINEIRNSVDIVDVISGYIPLTKKGKNYFGVCPFHEDHNPSMSVSSDKQIYTCFSCGATGNVFNFVMDYEHISFKEAVKKLASLSGIKVDIEDTKKNYNESKLYKIYDLALLFYHNNINTKKGAKAKEYLFNRDITDDVINTFKIGYSTRDKDNLTKLLKSKEYKDEELVKSGLVVNNDYNYNDIYYDRIMFPLFDLQGRVVAFSGRSYDSSKEFKYINSKESEIFKKGDLLYNYDRARDYARTSKTIIVVEGFMDVIRLHIAGFDNVVASMGTAITKNQAMLIKRLAPNIILMFDGDKAGLKATYSCLKELDNLNVQAKVVRLEDNMDPDDYIRKNGKEAIINKIEKAISGIDFKMNYFKEGLDPTDPTVLASYVSSMINEINNIQDPILREITINKLAKESNLEPDFIKDKINVKDEIIINKPVISKKLDKYVKAEQALLYYMMKSSNVIKAYNQKVTYIPTERYRYLAREISFFHNTYGFFNIADFMSYKEDDTETLKTIGEIVMLDLKEDYTDKEINDYINVIYEYDNKAEISKLTDLLKREIDPVKQAVIAEKIRELRIRRENNDERN